MLNSKKAFCNVTLNVVHFVLLALSVLAMPHAIMTRAQASSYDAPVAVDSRIKTFLYSENEIYELAFNPDYQGIIEFAVDENVDVISAGKAAGWKMVPMGNRLFITPTDIGQETNMIVQTNKRFYCFIISSIVVDDANKADLSFIVRFYYPNRNIDTADYDINAFNKHKTELIDKVSSPVSGVFKNKREVGVRYPQQALQMPSQNGQTRAPAGMRQIATQSYTQGSPSRPSFTPMPYNSVQKLPSQASLQAQTYRASPQSQPTNAGHGAYRTNLPQPRTMDSYQQPQPYGQPPSQNYQNQNYQNAGIQSQASTPAQPRFLQSPRGHPQQQNQYQGQYQVQGHQFREPMPNTQSIPDRQPGSN